MNLCSKVFGVSKVLFITTVLSILYAVYIVDYMISASTGIPDTAEGLGTAIGMAIIMPHTLSMGLCAIFTTLGFFLKKSWGTLVGAIIFSVGLVLMPLYFMFGIPLIVLGFVGFANQRNIEKKEKESYCKILLFLSLLDVNSKENK